MKKLLYLFLIVLLPSCMATKSILLSYKDYKGEKEISSKNNKHDLYLATNLWLIESFYSAKNIIQFADTEAGIVAGKYLIYEYPFVMNTKDIYAAITIKYKDNLTKIIITPIGEGLYYPPNTDTVLQPRNFPGPDEIKAKVNAIITEYETYVLNYKNW